MTITLASIISKNFAIEYEERRLEEACSLVGEAGAEGGGAAAGTSGRNSSGGADGTFSLPLFGECRVCLLCFFRTEDLDESHSVGRLRVRAHTGGL